MPSRASKDPNQVAHATVRALTERHADLDDLAAARSAAARALGALGASKGGKARAKALNKAERAAIAKKAAKARWKK